MPRVLRRNFPGLRGSAKGMIGIFNRSYYEEVLIVRVLPEILRGNPLTGRFYIGGTSLLIVVSVTMDTVAQIQSHLIGHQYEGMIKRARLGGKKK